MKHVANIMRMNDWKTDQESTVGRIFVKGRGKAKKHLILWLNGWKKNMAPTITTHALPHWVPMRGISSAPSNI